MGISEASVTGSYAAARAVGRSYGAMFFAVFGGAWFLLSAYAFGRLNWVSAGLIIVVVGVLLAAALRFRGRGLKAGKDGVAKEERERNDRMFGIINAVTWTAVFLAFRFLQPPHGNLAVPVVVAIVGLHFFPMPRLYQHQANLVMGGCMVIWAVVCVLAFHGDAMIAFAAGGAGIALWLGSMWALKTAGELMRANGL